MHANPWNKQVVMWQRSDFDEISKLLFRTYRKSITVDALRDKQH